MQQSVVAELGGAPNGMRDPRFVQECEGELSLEERRALMRELSAYDTIRERDDDR